MNEEAPSIPYRPLPAIRTVATLKTDQQDSGVPACSGKCEVLMPLRRDGEVCGESAVAWWHICDAKVRVCVTHAHLLAVAGYAVTELSPNGDGADKKQPL